MPPGSRPGGYAQLMTPELMLDFTGIARSPARSEDKNLSINVHFTNVNKTYSLVLENGVLNYANKPTTNSAAEISLETNVFFNLITRSQTVQKMHDEGKLAIKGNITEVTDFFELLTPFIPNFPLVTP